MFRLGLPASYFFGRATSYLTFPEYKGKSNRKCGIAVRSGVCLALVTEEDSGMNRQEEVDENRFPTGRSFAEIAEAR
jgi:hypothetical protein